MYLNFGEIGLNIKVLVDRFQKTSKSHAQIESIADMKVGRVWFSQFRCGVGLTGIITTLCGDHLSLRQGTFVHMHW